MSLFFYVALFFLLDLTKLPKRNEQTMSVVEKLSSLDAVSAGYCYNYSFIETFSAVVCGLLFFCVCVVRLSFVARSCLPLDMPGRKFNMHHECKCAAVEYICPVSVCVHCSNFQRL